MAIIKAIIDPADYDNFYGTVTATNADTDRSDGAIAFGPGQNNTASWEEPAGNSLWFKVRYTASGNNSNWDDFGVFQFQDKNGTTVMRFDVFDFQFQWVIWGDTSATRIWRANSTYEFFWDINFVKNGTTDVTMFIYLDGNFMGSATSSNAVDNGLPVNFTVFNQDSGGSGAAGTSYASEMIIADEDTRGMRIRQHRILAHGETSDWAGSALGMIDRRSDWGVYSNTLDQRAAFGVSRLETIPIGILIDRIWIQTKAQRGPTGLTRFNPYFRWEDTTVVDGADQLITEDLRYYSFEYTTSPDTTNRWSYTEFPGLQIGVRART